MPKFITLTPKRLAKRKIDIAFLFFFTGSLAAVFAVQLSGLSIGRWGVDEGGYLLAIARGGAGAQSLADHVVALLTPYFGVRPLYNALPTVGIVYVIARIAYQADLREKLIIFFLSFPLVFQLKFVSKEAVIALFVIALFVLFTFVRSEKVRFFIGMGGLAVMAATFRQYYLISMAFGFCIFFIRRKDFLFFALVSGLIFASLIEAIRVPLLTSRYFVYYGVSVFSVSKTPLLFTEKGAIDFVGNYFSSLFFYLFPIVLNFRIQEIYLQIYMVFIFFSIKEALTYGNRTLIALFCGMVLTLPVFVPDLGTLSRHLSALTPLLFMSFYFARQDTRRAKIITHHDRRSSTKMDAYSSLASVSFPKG